MKNQKVCCFISGAFMPFFENKEEDYNKKEITEKIKEEIKNLIEKENVNVFYTGMEEGADLFCAECVLSFKKNNDISLNCVIPFEEQAKDYCEETRDLYFSVAQRCDNEIMLNKKRNFSCRKERDIYMIEKSDIVFLFWDMKAPYTSSLLKVASKNKKIIVVDPSFSRHNSSFRRIE